MEDKEKKAPKIQKESIKKETNAPKKGTKKEIDKQNVKKNIQNNVKKEGYKKVENRANVTKETKPTSTSKKNTVSSPKIEKSNTEKTKSAVESRKKDFSTKRNESSSKKVENKVTVEKKSAPPKKVIKKQTEGKETPKKVIKEPIPIEVDVKTIEVVEEVSTLKMNMDLDFAATEEKSKLEKLSKNITTLEEMKKELKENILEEIEANQDSLKQEQEDIYTIDSIHTEINDGPHGSLIEKSLEETTTIHIRKKEDKAVVTNALADIFTGAYQEDPIMEEKNTRTFKREIAKPDMPPKRRINRTRLFLLLLITGLSILTISLLIFIGIHFSSYNHHPKKVTMETLAPNYLFLGDSITEVYDLDKYYKNMPVVNSGRGGYKTYQILENMEEMAYRYNPSKIFLLIGTNDVSINKSKTSIINNIIKIIEELKENRPNAKIYVESIYPTGSDTTYTIREINKEIKKYCGENDITYIDVFSKLQNKKGNIKEEYTKDGVHLSTKGYEVVTDIIKPYIQEKEKD